MTDGHLSNEEFYFKLAELFASRRDKDHGSIHLTQKRLSRHATSLQPSGDPLEDLTPVEPLPVIFHATNGKGKDKRKEKVKLSTVVNPEELDVFFIKYADICKAGMTSLKKRDRKARAKKAAAKKKKGGSNTQATGN